MSKDYFIFLKLTDLCGHCETIISLKNKIGKYLKDELFENYQNYEFDKIIAKDVQKTLKIRKEIPSADKTNNRIYNHHMINTKVSFKISNILSKFYFHEKVTRVQRIEYKNDHASILAIKRNYIRSK
jgi:hypothetical protein